MENEINLASPARKSISKENTTGMRDNVFLKWKLFYSSQENKQSFKYT